MVLVDRSYGQTDNLYAVQVTYQKKRLRDTSKIRDSQTDSKESLFPLFFMKKVPGMSFQKKWNTVTVMVVW